MAKQAGVRKSPHFQFIYKGLGTQVSASLLTMLLYASILMLFGVSTQVETASEPNRLGMIVAGLLGTLLLCMMIYSLGWHIGNRDQNLVRYGHIKHRPRRALYGYATSQIPGLIVVVLAILEANGWISIPWAVMVARFLYFPFAWIFDWAGPHTFFLIYCIPFLLLPPFCHWGYTNGYQFISLWRKIVYKGQSDPVRNRAKDKRLR